jgi:hypothetical protein
MTDGANDEHTLFCHFEPGIGNIEGAFDIMRQTEAQGGLVLERVFDLELDDVLLPLLGQRNPGLLGNATPAVGQLELDGLSGGATYTEGEAVASAVELDMVAKGEVEA